MFVAQPQPAASRRANVLGPCGLLFGVCVGVHFCVRAVTPSVSDARVHVPVYLLASAGV